MFGVVIPRHLRLPVPLRIGDWSRRSRCPSRRRRRSSPSTFWNISINIMSPAGVILRSATWSIACVLVENAHKKIAEAEREGNSAPRSEIVIASARELGPSMFGASRCSPSHFLPVFSPRAKRVGFCSVPLALAKTFSMAFASVVRHHPRPCPDGELPEGQDQAGGEETDQSVPHRSVYRPIRSWSARAVRRHRACRR